MLNEFDIIRTCFDQPGLAALTDAVIRQGIGDDCALLSIPAGKELAFSMDTLVAGVHFPGSANPIDIGWRALAVNLSDLAATGAMPLAFTLGLTLPDNDEQWLQTFAEGLKQPAQEFGCYLVGGDLTRGPLAITIQVHGLVDKGKAIGRGGARPGDLIYVTGTLGRAGAALALLDNDAAMAGQDGRESLLQAYYRPVPRIIAARALKGFVSAGIDISDGLVADLGHICQRSGCGARVNAAEVPVDPLVTTMLGKKQGLTATLGAGDDYELILTVPRENEEDFREAEEKLPELLTCIGEITAGNEIICEDEHGEPMAVAAAGYNHFSEPS